MRSPKREARAQNGADEKACGQQLSPRRNASASVPTVEAMAREELAAVGPREPEHVLQVWRRSSQRPYHGRVEWAAHQGQEEYRSDPGADLEPAIADVLMRHPVPRQVEEEAERKRVAPRTHERTAGRARGDVEGDDQRGSRAGVSTAGSLPPDEERWEAEGLNRLGREAPAGDPALGVRNPQAAVSSA